MIGLNERETVVKVEKEVQGGLIRWDDGMFTVGGDDSCVGFRRGRPTFGTGNLVRSGTLTGSG